MKVKNLALIASLALFAAPHAFALTDAEIAEMVMTANEAEMDAAKVAKSTAADRTVKEFAEHMIDEHKKTMSDGKKVTKEEKIKMKSIDAAKALKKTAKEQLGDLKKKKGIDFDRAYIENQVGMHQQLLDDLNEKYIPQAQNSQLKTFLNETKDHVEKHLAKAKEIQTTLTK